MIIIQDSFLDFSIALTSGISALFIPLFYTVVIRLDEKYESRLIIKIFWSEKIVKRFLYSTVILIASTLIFSLKIPPLYFSDNFFISNSAAFVTAIILIMNLFLGYGTLKKMNKYQNPEELFDLIGDLENIEEKQKRIVRFDLFFHSLKDLNHNKDFTEKICAAFENEILQFKNERQSIPIEYYDALEQLIALVIGNNYFNESRHNKKTLLSLWNTIFFARFPIDSISYSFMWNHLLMSLENDWDIIVQKHWERADSYIKMINYKLTDLTISNEIEGELDSRSKFLEEFYLFFIVLGSLIFYKRKLNLLKNCINYTSSWPPEYNLIPENSNIIFKYFKDLNDPYDSNNIWLSWKFSFPGSSGFDQDLKIKGSINEYLIFLLIRIRQKKSSKIIFDRSDINKYECIQYLESFNLLTTEISKSKDFDFYSNILGRSVTSEDLENLKNQIEEIKIETKNHLDTLKSKEQIDDLKIKKFCDNIKRELLSFYNEISKIKLSSDIQSTSLFKYDGIKCVVDKDFFVNESLNAYLNYEESFSSIFKQNFTLKLGFEIDQKVVQNLTYKLQDIINTIESLNESVIVLNFGLEFNGVISDKKIVNFGRIQGVSPRVFLINSYNNEFFGIQYDKIELHKDFEFTDSIILNKLSIGLGNITKGDLLMYFKNEIIQKTEIENVIGIEIASAISFFIPENLKTVCLIEYQPYRVSKEPDKLDINEITEILEII